jgi:ATP phosphoribosyltransferase
MRGAVARHPAPAGYEQEALCLLTEIRDTLRIMRKATVAIRSEPANITAVTELLFAAQRCPDLEAALDRNTTAVRRARRRRAFWEMIEAEEAAHGEPPGVGRHLRSVPRAG